MTGRRSFLKALLVIAVVDPERLLWVPGEKIISIPKSTPTVANLLMCNPGTISHPYPIQMILHPLQIEAYNRLRSWNHGS